MKYDLGLTFGEIFHDDIIAFRRQLLDIQHHRADRKASEKWAEDLRFLDVSEVPNLDELDAARPSKRARTRYRPSRAHESASARVPSLTIPLVTKKIDNASYIAVSWKWTEGKRSLSSHGCYSTSRFDYRIQRQGETPQKSDFPDCYLERAILFAQSEGITNIWVDKESIYQREADKSLHPKDKDLGVQIMDLVYASSKLSLGILTTSLVHQSEVDMLAALLSKTIFINKKDTELPRIKSSVDQLGIQTLILRILSDPRWSRGWIFQEDHLGSDRMILLIPHSPNAKKGKQYDFGTIPGELRVNAAVFRQVVTLFCIARGEADRWPVSEILGKAKQYNIWNKLVYEEMPKSDRFSSTDGNGRGGYLPRDICTASLYPTTTLSVLDDICHRNLFKEEDRVAIMANAAKFSVRLDIREASALVQSEEYSLSTVLLALILLNGEMLTGSLVDSSSILDHNLHSYLKATQRKFNAPNSKFPQTFIDRCRLRSPTLVQNGIQTKGFLFVIPLHASSPLRLEERDHEHLNVTRDESSARKWRNGRLLKRIEERVIHVLIERLQQSYGKQFDLVHFIKKHLELDHLGPSEKDYTISTSCTINMLCAIANALVANRDIHLAWLEGEDANGPPSAIFIAPIEVGSWVSPTSPPGDSAHVFTSWDNGWRRGGMETQASIQVETVCENEASDGSDRQAVSGDIKIETASRALEPRGWVNGVWCAKGKKMRDYTFPIPGI